ncbi:MAG: alpha/beta hydrolase [Anaerolineales bacterium]
MIQLLFRLINLAVTIALSWIPVFPFVVTGTPSKQPPYFEPTACMIDLPAGYEGERVVCGYLVVPEIHSQPQGKTIRLAVIILKSISAHPRPDPLIMMQGGPGGSTIETYAERLLSGSRLLADRDIILFDQRGTLYSQPALTCPEIFELTIRTLNQNLSTQESLRLYEKAILACRERLITGGINLSAYNSFENAADVADLQAALNYPVINLYGVSYGTLLALHVMRFQPEGIRSVILDGVVPPQVNFILEAPRTQNQAFTHLFDACTQDENCNQNYPELEKVFFELVSKLDQTPAQITIKDDETGQEYLAVLNGEGLINTLFQMLYVTEAIPAIPATIYDIRAGKYDFLQRFLGWVTFDRSMSYGMYYSVLCAEDADFDPKQVRLEGVRPAIAKDEEISAASFISICKSWDIKELGKLVDEPVLSDVPTLILSGAIDPITPPDFGAIAAATLPQSYTFTFPNTGHGAALSGECPDKIILEFLENPQQPPIASCFAELQPPEFFTPQRVIPIPSLNRLINLEMGATIQIFFFLSATLFLLTPWGIWLLIWLARRITKPSTHPTPRLGYVLKWLSLLNGPAMLIFFTAITIITLYLAFDNNYVIFFGLPSKYRSLFLLPILVALLTIILLAGSIKVWISRYWTIWERIYFTALVLTSVVAVIILASWQMLFVFS